jgi:adenylylsulfate kinase
MAAAPAIPALNNLVTPPTDAQTLVQFTPSDDVTAEIEECLTQHPIAQELRRNPAFVESRPHLKIPEEARSHNLTGGTLSGPGRIWVPPLSFAEKGGKSITILYYLGGDMCGHPGIVHGGCLATILDEGLARCCFAALPNKVGMTANLNIDYRAPVPANSFVVLRATTTKVEGRKAWVDGRLESASLNQEKATVFCEAKGLFIEPKQAAVSPL